MSDPELKLEHRRGAKPKAAGPLTTQTIQEEARVASTEQHALQLRGTDFYLPLGGQPRISERKSWRAPIVTEQGNPGIYVQIDEWLSLYKGNIYVVDEITGRMYLSKGEHLMRIAETANHHPFQDHELSISRHVPEREYAEPTDWVVREEREKDQRWSNLDPITPIAGVTGEMGRTPIPVAESTRQPEKGMFTPGDVPRERESEQEGVPVDSSQSQRGTAERGLELQRRIESEWALPKPSEPRRPPGEGTIGGKVPSHSSGRTEGEPSRRERDRYRGYP